MKLSIGSIIIGKGITFHKGIESGSLYKVIDIVNHNGKFVYSFAKGKLGKKIIISHYAESIDGTIESTHLYDSNNGIKKL